MSNNKKRILDAFVNGKINGYLAHKLQKAVSDDIDDDTLTMALDDAISATEFGVDNEKDYNTKYYLDNLLDEILKETFNVSLNSKEKDKLKKFLFENKHNKEFDLSNLLDIRILIHTWLSKVMSKNAYPNVGMGLYKTKTYDLPRWIDALEKIYDMVKKGFDETKATNLVIYDWDSVEQYQFMEWKKFYQEGGSSMYNIKTANFPFVAPTSNELSRTQSPNLTTFKSKQEQEKTKAVEKKKQMLSRIRSLRKLLSDFSDISTTPSSKSGDILDTIYELEKKVLTLTSEAVVKSSIVKTANVLARDGFAEEASELYKIADEPGAPPAATTQSVETPAQNQDAPTAPTTEAPKSSSPGVSSIIDKLEVISKELKDRNLVRSLAMIDIDLHQQGLAAYFTEISDSQSKLIEGFGYASNKIESVLAKLRGSQGQPAVLEQGEENKANKLEKKELGDATKPADAAPNVPAPTGTQPAAPAEKANPQELMNKPVGDVKNNLPGS